MAISEELAKRFQGDRFAALAGVEIREAEPGRALCALVLEERHMNANGSPMGGAVFTLVDFAFAVAANGYGGQTVVSQQASITFLAPARGSLLLAEAKRLKAGRTASLYQVTVRDEIGTYVAHATINGFAVAK